MAEIGDIVSSNGTRWVVAAFAGNAHGGRTAKLVRRRTDSKLRMQKTHDAAGLTVVESPVFKVGDVVRRGAAKVIVNAIDGDNIVLQARPGVRTRIPKWQLVLENSDV